jgi:hypothetical protein
MSNQKSTLPSLLERMSRIDGMERGTLCRMRGRPHYNHQTWRNGRNVVRYVPRDQVARLREAIAGYRRFMALAEQYAEQIIRRTRRETRPAPRAVRRPKQS